MRTTLVLLAAGLLSAPAATAGNAQSLGFCFGPGPFCPGDGNSPFPNQDTNFDLGVDVSNLPLTHQAVNQFMATQPPEGQHIMQATCRNYLNNPTQVQSYRTLDFCHVLVGG